MGRGKSEGKKIQSSKTHSKITAKLLGISSSLNLSDILQIMNDDIKYMTNEEA